MIPHFELARGKERFLLFRMGEEFHIIDCDEALTKEKRFAILESGCTPAEMQEMGLSGTTIAKSDLTAITVTGCGPQDDVIFYLGKKQLSYRFAAAYEQRRVDDFFRGIPRKQYKTRWRFEGGKKQDWRVRERNYALYKKLVPFGWAWNILCILVGVGRFFAEINFEFWCWIVLAMALATVLADCVLPQYFTILFRGKHSRRHEPKHAIHLGVGLSVMLAIFAVSCVGRYHFFDSFRLLPPAIILTVILGVCLFLFCREFMEEPECGIGAVLLVLLLSFSVIAHLNHALGGELTPATAQVVDQYSRRSGKRGRNYYCTVTMPDGRELDVRVSKAEYDSYELGDMMELQYGTGFFGIEYAIDE